MPFIETVRDVDASVEAVYRAHCEPELVARWLGPYGYDMKIERWDMRTGGGYRYVHVNEKGEEFTFNGVFHIAGPNEFVVQRFEFEASRMSSASRRSASRTWATDAPASPSTAPTPDKSGGTK